MIDLQGWLDSIGRFRDGSLRPDGLHWTPDGRECWYNCRECYAVIEEHHKPAMLAAGRWVAGNPESTVRGYTVNGLYYPIGLGPRWLDLVRMWLDAQGDPAKLKTNGRSAEGNRPDMDRLSAPVALDKVQR